jgi:hypothetical protein
MQFSAGGNELMEASNDPHASSPENPLEVPGVMHCPEGTHYFRVPDPRGKSVSEIQREMSNPSLGMAVVVEMKVGQGRWEFRYIWATWALAVDFCDGQKWDLVVRESGPRTEMQVRVLYELASDLHFRECVEFFHHKWPDVKSVVLPKGKKGAGHGPWRPKTKADEEQAVVKLKIAAAKAGSVWRRRHDPETIVLQAFLQGRANPEMVCELFDLDEKTCVPFLRGLQDAYDRLIRDAVASRCEAIHKAHRTEKITLQEAADLLALSTPAAEDILRIGAYCDRELQPTKEPTNQQLSQALESIASLRSAGQKEKSI